MQMEVLLLKIIHKVLSKTKNFQVDQQKEQIRNLLLHEEKFLNKTFGYTDTSDSFKIQKDSKGYFVTQYIDDSEEKDGSGPIKEEKLRLKLVKNVFLTEVDGDGLTYAYDTKLKKVVLINPANNYRIIFVVD